MGRVAAGWCGALRTGYQQTYLFGPPNRILVVKRWRWPGSNKHRSEIIGLDTGGRAVEFVESEVPDGFPAAHPFRRMVALPLSFGEDLVGRMFVLDPKLDVRLIELARFLQTVVQQVAPALFNVYLSNQLRAKAGALERARVARELHDGVIQSLIGLEMRLDVLRRSDGLKGTTTADELARLQVVARDEVVALRDLMQQMRPSELDPDELLDNMADFVQRFARETSIVARFVTQLHDVRLPRRVCFELLRICQESLVNVRKHSDAKNVTVRFEQQDGYWLLSVDDDGRGFPFDGRLDLAELDASGRGPSIIKERVHAIGAQLVVQSTPGSGSRLEVHIPQGIRG